jgi:AraC family transcriptional regulator
MALYHDDPCSVPEAELQSDAAVLLPDGHSPTANRGMAVIELPAGSYARSTHVGPYSELPRAWREFQTHFQQSGLRQRGSPALEIYGAMDAAPRPPVTELYLPIED